VEKIKRRIQNEFAKKSSGGGNSSELSLIVEAPFSDNSWFGYHFIPFTDL